MSVFLGLRHNPRLKAVVSVVLAAIIVGVGAPAAFADNATIKLAVFSDDIVVVSLHRMPPNAMVGVEASIPNGRGYISAKSSDAGRLLVGFRPPAGYEGAVNVVASARSVHLKSSVNVGARATADALPLAAVTTTSTVAPTTTSTSQPVATTAKPQPAPKPPAVPPSPGAAASGQAMPVGDLPGWKQIFTEDFNTPVNTGSFPGAAYSSKWWVYRDGWKDTWGQRGGAGRYMPSKVLSVRDGLLNFNVRTENGMHMGSAPVPKFANGSSDQIYGRYSVRFRAENVRGYKIAFLLWPQSDRWPHDGEIDFPEGDLHENRIYGFMHHATAAGTVDGFGMNTPFSAWHTATTEWQPGKVTFILDGKVIGVSTKMVPSKPMHYVLQTETCIRADCQPNSSARGNIQVDWVSIYSRK